MHISADFAPYGRTPGRARCEQALGSAGIALQRTGSPYAVAPGTLTNGSGDPFQVFSPFHRAWQDHGVHDPAPGVRASCGRAGSKAEDRIALEDRRSGAGRSGR